MMTSNDFLVPSVDADVDTFDYSSLPDDVAEDLRQYARDAHRYQKQTLESLFQLAHTMKRAKDRLVSPRAGRGGKWASWVRSESGLSLSTADQLVKVAERYPQEISLFERDFPEEFSSMTSGIALLLAPENIQERVESGQDIGLAEMKEAALLAQKAQRRTQELEVALSKANTELRDLEGARQSAQRTLDLALKESENSNLRLKLLQDEMEKRVASATASERAALEKQYTSEIAKARDAAEKARAEADKERLQHDHALKTAMANARKALQERDQLAEQLKHAGDDSSKWAKWEITSVRIARQLEQMVKDLPPEEDMAVWLPIHWQLMDEVIDAAETLRSTLLERKRVRSVQGSVVQAD